MNLDLIGEFLISYTMVPLIVEDLIAGSIQAHDDSAYDFNEDEVEGVLLLWNIIIIFVTLLLIVFLYIYPLFDCLGSSPFRWRLLNY